jgi:hypothetical protein
MISSEYYTGKLHQVMLSSVLNYTKFPRILFFHLKVAVSFRNIVQYEYSAKQIFEGSRFLREQEVGESVVDKVINDPVYQRAVMGELDENELQNPSNEATQKGKTGEIATFILRNTKVSICELEANLFDMLVLIKSKYSYE